MSARSTKPSFADKVRDFWQNVKRIIRVARRPSAHEVRLIARVSGIGILIVGVVAYLIQIVGTLVNEFFLPASTSSSTTSVQIMFVVNSLLIIVDYLPAIILSLAATPSLLMIFSGASLIGFSFKR